MNEDVLGQILAELQKLNKNFADAKIKPEWKKARDNIRDMYCDEIYARKIVEVAMHNKEKFLTLTMSYIYVRMNMGQYDNARKIGAKAKELAKRYYASDYVNICKRIDNYFVGRENNGNNIQNDEEKK